MAEMIWQRLDENPVKLDKLRQQPDETGATSTGCPRGWSLL